MERKDSICIVGTGKVAQALIKNLKEHYELCITSPSQTRAKYIAESYQVNFLPYGKKTSCQRFIIVRKDKDIAQTSQELKALYPKSQHIHMSGLLSSEILSTEKRCSMHPILSITPDSSFKGILFAVEGDIDICTDIINSLKSKYFVIDTDKKPLYHTALVFISNFTALNTLIGITLLREVGKLPPEIVESVKNLAYISIENVLTYGLNGLTGPAARGDMETINIETSLLKGLPLELYKLQSDVIYKLHKGGGENNGKDNGS